MYIVIRRLANGPDNLPADARLFIEVVADGNRVQKTKLLTQDPGRRLILAVG